MRTLTNVLYVSVEVAPYAATGGLADVAKALPSALCDENVNVRIVMPYFKQAKDFNTKQNVQTKPCTKVGVFMAGKYESADILKSENITDNRIKTYFVSKKAYFLRDGLYSDNGGIYDDNEKRFLFFSKTVVELIKYFHEYEGWTPDVIHLHDWHTAPIALYVKEIYKSMKPFDRASVIYTIHNVAYQGALAAVDFPMLGISREYFNYDKIEFNGTVNFMKMGIKYADFVTTVSPNFALEIQDRKYGFGLDGFLRDNSFKLKGILNGADYSVFNPETGEGIAKAYSANDLSGKEECKRALLEELGLEYKENTPLLGFVGRLDEQKGMRVILSGIDRLIKAGTQLVILGAGENAYEQILKSLEEQYKGRFAFRAEFNSALAKRIFAGADIFLMPSSFEPCGLTQMYAMRYGTIPVAYHTGGLVDTIEQFDGENGTGVIFGGMYESGGFIYAVNVLLNIFKDENLRHKIIYNAMTKRFSWENATKEYMAVYQNAIENTNRKIDSYHISIPERES